MRARLGASCRAAVCAVVLGGVLASTSGGLAVAQGNDPGAGPAMDDSQPAPEEDTPRLPTTQTMVERAVADAAAQAGLDASQVTVVSVMEVEWPNTSLGCPEPGQAYAQVVTPGLLIVVEAAGARISYHTDRATRMVVCDSGPPPEI